MKKTTKPPKAPASRKPKFDIESVPLADKLNRFVLAEPYRITAAEQYALITGSIPTPHGFVLFQAVKFPNRERESMQLRFIHNGRAYMGSVAGYCPARSEVAGIAERFAAACTRLKAQDVDGAKGILK